MKYFYTTLILLTVFFSNISFSQKHHWAIQEHLLQNEYFDEIIYLENNGAPRLVTILRSSHHSGVPQSPFTYENRLIGYDTTGQKLWSITLPYSGNLLKTSQDAFILYETAQDSVEIAGQTLYLSDTSKSYPLYRQLYFISFNSNGNLVDHFTYPLPSGLGSSGFASTGIGKIILDQNGDFIMKGVGDGITGIAGIPLIFNYGSYSNTISNGYNKIDFICRLSATGQEEEIYAFKHNLIPAQYRNGLGSPVLNLSDDHFYAGGFYRDTLHIGGQQYNYHSTEMRPFLIKLDNNLNLVKFQDYDISKYSVPIQPFYNPYTEEMHLMGTWRDSLIWSPTQIFAGHQNNYLNRFIGKFDDNLELSNPQVFISKMHSTSIAGAGLKGPTFDPLGRVHLYGHVFDTTIFTKDTALAIGHPVQDRTIYIELDNNHNVNRALVSPNDSCKGYFRAAVYDETLHRLYLAGNILSPVYRSANLILTTPTQDMEAIIFPLEWGDIALNQQEVLTSELNVYPNPASEFIQIEGIRDNAIVRILDVQGKCVLSENPSDNLINISQFSAGLYFVVVEENDRSYTHKLIIE